MRQGSVSALDVRLRLTHLPLTPMDALTQYAGTEPGELRVCEFCEDIQIGDGAWMAPAAAPAGVEHLVAPRRTACRDCLAAHFPEHFG